MRTLSASPDAHMFLSTASLLSDSHRNLALQPAPDPASLHFRARAQLQEAAAMMWGEVGAPWLYLEKAAEVSELLLQNSCLQPPERQILLQQRALLASTHAHLATSLQLWKRLEGTAAKLTAATGQSAAHAVATDSFATSPTSSPPRPTSASSRTRPTSPTSPIRLKRGPADAPQSPLSPSGEVASREEGGPRGGGLEPEGGMEAATAAAAVVQSSSGPQQWQQQLQQPQQQPLQQQPQPQQQQLQQQMQQQLDAAGRRLAHLRRWLANRPPSTADGQTQASSSDISREASQHAPKEATSRAASPPEGSAPRESLGEVAPLGSAVHGWAATRVPEPNDGMHLRSLDLDGAASVLRSPSNADRPPSPAVPEPEAHHDESLGTEAAEPQGS